MRWERWDYSEGIVCLLTFAVKLLGMGTVFENGHFGSHFHFSLAVLVGVLDLETPTKRFC